jgi:glycosyltransferase involved in cell wall biosynthesis
MKIAVLSKADAFGGGASRIAVELTTTLTAAGVDARHYAGWGGRARLRERYPAGVTPVFGPSRLPRVAVKLGLAAQWSLGVPEALPIEWPAVARSGLLDADLIHVHDITELLSARSLLRLSQHKPVVWTLHDYSPFTAGCLYPFENEPLGCTRWQVDQGGCTAACPLRVGRAYPFGGVFNGVPLLWRAKARLAAQGRMTLTSPSSWLADEAARSALYAGRRPAVIFNGIDVHEVFAPQDKALLRQRLGLDGTGPLIVMMAGDLADRNKGFAWGVEALERLPAELRASAQLLCIGRTPPTAPERLAGIAVRWTGYVDDGRRMAELLGAADLMLYPSLADNQPLAVIEAMACATPVFAFETGGIPEIIGEEGGVVVPRKDTAALAQAISDVVQGRTLEGLGISARRRAVMHFSRERMAADFVALYKQVLAA